MENTDFLLGGCFCGHHTWVKMVGYGSNFSLIGMVASCIGIFILAALYEGLKVSREILKRKYSYAVSVDMSGSKTYSNGQTVITESRGKPPRLVNVSLLPNTESYLASVAYQWELRLKAMIANFYCFMHKLCTMCCTGATETSQIAFQVYRRYIQNLIMSFVLVVKALDIKNSISLHLTHQLMDWNLPVQNPQ